VSKLMMKTQKHS